MACLWASISKKPTPEVEQDINRRLLAVLASPSVRYMEALKEHEDGLSFRRFEVISLLDMQTYLAERMSNLALEIRHLHEQTSDQGRMTLFGLPAFVAGLKKISTEAQFLGLIVVRGEAESVILNPNNYANVGQMRTTLEGIERAMRHELTAVKFVHIENKNLPYLDGFESLEQQVKDNFPSIKYEMEEAGNCYAVGCSTASVCHLMRALEFCLKALADSFNKTFTASGWDDVIKFIQTESNRVVNTPTTTRVADWKELQQFYAEAAANFRFIKDAWRNYAMHVYEKYTEQEAEAIWLHSRAFITHLATRIKEKS